LVDIRGKIILLQHLSLHLLILPCITLVSSPLFDLEVEHEAASIFC
jgi:hypothetical protein